jgi:antitoxin VapB
MIILAFAILLLNSPLGAPSQTIRCAIALLMSHIQFKIFAYSKYTHGERKMSLYIRDNDVDALAVRVQQLTKAPNKTEAVRRALQNELARAQEAIPLKDRIKIIQDDVKARMGPNKPDFDMKKYTDEMWGV